MDLKGRINKFIKKNQKETNTKIETTCVRTELTEEEKRMLEDVHKFKEGYTPPAAVTMANHFASIRNINLDAKVDNFIDWYFKNMVKGNYTDIVGFHKTNDMRNFIEKMAVWYELRYPDYEINRLMPGSGHVWDKINDVMFNQNKYINDLFDENADIRALDWSEFYNAKAFINSLPWDERILLAKAKYKDLVYIDSHHISAHLHLTSKGFVEISEGIGDYTNFKVKDSELEGMHIKDVVKLLKEKGFSLPNGNELEETIKDVEKWNYQKEEMINCVMYRIIERGGNRMGPRRAFLFAKEFGRNIDIPMMYSVDYTDPGLRMFINEYIKAGGSKDLVCYVDYFSKASKNEKMSTVSVQDMIKTIRYSYYNKYTPEETELHQRMVNALIKQVDQDKVKVDQDKIKEYEVKQLRLQRKLNKSKNI